MKKKLLVPVLCILMMLVGGFATWAYLTSQDSVTNTFTVGKINITLDEADVDEDGKYVTDVDKRVEENEYHLVPGHLYIKDPTVHIQADSEDCYVYVSVLNEIAAIETTVKADTIATQMENHGWIPLFVDGAAVKTENGGTVFYYENVVARDKDNITHLTVFDNFRIDGVTVKNLQGEREEGQLYIDDYAGKQIVVNAYAIQADGFNTAAAAWTAAHSQF